MNCTPAQVLITSGALQALQLISVSLLSAGSTVFAEAPSYIKSLQVFQSAGMRLSGVPMDDQGFAPTLLNVHWENTVLYRARARMPCSTPFPPITTPPA